MAVITIRSFNGVSPKTPPRFLQDSQAQTANNCDVFRGSLSPMKGVGASVATVSGGSKTLYKFGQDSTDASAGWLSFANDVDVARSQITGDTEEWTFYSGNNAPKAIRAGYTSSPIPLGIPAPATALIATEGTLPENSDELVAETRIYTYTYVNKVGAREFESAPAPAALSVDVVTGQNVALSGVATPPSGYAATYIRIYRSTQGTFLFVGELTTASALGGYTDTVDPELLAEELPSLFWLPPPDALAGLSNLPNGMMAGFVGRDVYFCEPYVPHAWPDAYRQTIDYPVVGLGSIDTTLVVLTKGAPYIIQGSHPDAMVVVRAGLEQSCVAKRSIVSMNNAVLFASPDGLVSISNSGSSIMTQSIYTRDQWNSLIKPESVVAYQHDNKYIGFYNNGVTTGSFIFDFASGQFSLNDTYATAGFNWLQGDTLYVLQGGSIVPWNEGSNLTYNWKSKLFTMPRPLSMACAQVEAEAYPLTCKIYGDGVLIHTQTVASRLPFRLPPLLARDWELEVIGTNEIFMAAIGQSMQELANA